MRFQHLLSKSLLKTTILTFVSCVIFTACRQPESEKNFSTEPPIIGTWELVSNLIITKGDTVIAYPVVGKSEVMIKMYNQTHFSFFRHDTKKGKTPDAVYDSGAGTYKLSGDDYKESLEFYTQRDWEQREFNFKLVIKNDTLIQSGTEKIDSLNINHEIIETYVRKD